MPKIEPLPAAAAAPATLLKPIDRKNDCSYFFLLFPAAAAPDPATPVAGCGAYSPTIHSSKSPWQLRTEKHQNCAQKLPNVTSETHRTCYFSDTHRKNNLIVATFSSCFLLLLLLLLLLLRWQAATPKIEPLPAANPHGSEGRKASKLHPKTS